MKHFYRIFTFVRELWPYYTVVIVLAVVVSLLNLAIPFIMKQITDLIVGGLQVNEVNIQGVIWWAVGLLAVDVATTLIHNGAGYAGDIMSARLRQVLSERYYRQLLDLSQRYFDNELTGKIINRLNRTITEVTQFINMFANNIFSMYLTLVAALVILFMYSWQLGMMMVILYPVFMWLTTRTSKKWQVWQQKKNQETDIASGRFAEVVAQIRVVKSFVRQDAEYGLFARRNRSVVTMTREQSAYWHRMDIWRRLVLNVIFFAALAYVFVATANGTFSVGDMVLLATLLQQMRFPVFNMSFVIDNFQKAIAGSRDYFAVMDLAPDIKDRKNATRLHVEKGEIRFDGVSFGYDEKDQVLSEITFTIRPGAKYAFVGKSGEGKTTLTNLLLRMYDVDNGTISIDGKDIRGVTLKSLHQSIGVVFQEPALFSGTIRENITYGNVRATNDEIERAARDANAYEFISKLEKGFDTEIGERGLKLSGGQKQRIAIARAILKDAPILILDEATSSLDSRSEALVQEALDRLMRGRTVIIIAHRLSTIAGVDMIVTLKNGRIDEIGTPAELAQTDGIYARLLKLQTDASEATKKRLKAYDIDG